LVNLVCLVVPLFGPAAREKSVCPPSLGAAHALAADCAVVTDNEREFSRIGGLKVENWLR